MQALLEYGVSNAVMATVLALLAAVVGKVCRCPALVHTLWLLVLLKLITPPFFPVSVALPAREERSLAINPALEGTFPASGTSATTEEFFTLLADDPHDGPVSGNDNGDVGQGVPAVAASPSPSPSHLLPEATGFRSAGPPVPWSGWIVGAWLAGSAYWFTLAGIRVYRFHRLLRHARPASAAIQEQAQRLAAELGMRRCPQVCFVSGRISPLLWALGRRARLVVPSGLWEQLGAEPRKTLLAHELAHARRRDHWVRWCEFLVTGLYWWHPVAWWAKREIQNVEETCCDAWVVWVLPGAARAYARALLETVNFLDARPALPPAASGIGHLPLLKRRLSMILRQPFSPRVSWPVQLATVLFGVVILPIAPQRGEATSPVDDEPAARTKKESTPPQKDSGDRTAELEKKLQLLEKKLDKIAAALNARHNQAGQQADEMKARMEEDVRRQVQAARDQARMGADQARMAEQAARMAQADAKTKIKEKAKEGEKSKSKDERVNVFRFNKDGQVHEFKLKSGDAKDMQVQIEAAVKGAVDPERMKAMSKEIEDAVNKAIDPQRMKQMEKQIDEIIKKNMDLEQMKGMEKHIKAIVDKNVNPERMKEVEKRIKVLVEKDLGPERMERMNKEIERALKQAQAQAEHAQAQAARAQAQAERARQNAELRQKALAEKAAQQDARVKSSATDETPRASSRQRNLEQRVDQLERKLDKIIHALESPPKQ